MADTKISAATSTTPAATDLIPLERPSSAVARYATIGNIVQSGMSIIHADNYASLQHAVDAATTLLDNKYGQSREGRAKIVLSPGGVYTLTAPLDLCDKQGIIIDGGSPIQGAVIYSKAKDKIAIECIGSQNIQFRNLEIYGDTTDRPDVGIMVSRSNATHGTNAVHVTFDHVNFYGYFNHACYYGVETESNFFNNVMFAPSECGDALVYMGAGNDLAITPDNTTLANTGYGLYSIKFNDCHIGSTADTRAIYCRDMSTNGLVIRDSYLYSNSATKPTIEFEGSGIFTLDNVFFEGEPGTRVKFTYKAGANNYFFGSFRDMVWSSCLNYMIYADDNTDLRNVSFSGLTTMQPHSGAYTPISIYDTHQSDYRGLAYYQGGAFAFTVRNESIACYYRLSLDDTLTIANDYGNLIEDFSTALAPKLEISSTYGTVKLGGAWNTGHLVMGAAHIWMDSTGDLRINPTSAPANETDGTVIGTQT